MAEIHAVGVGHGIGPCPVGIEGAVSGDVEAAADVGPAEGSEVGGF